ncbi:TIGR00645 family protein, partial [Alphaproteobacteria bacterium]|nr:TIGR00645 family protein [Alphaproteobacteria bacterium]
MNMLKSIEHILEKVMFASRWLMAPFYLGLIICLIVLLITFCSELIHFFTGGMTFEETEIILFALTLIDLSFTGNLLLIVIFSGYENFVSKIDVANHEDKPSWMGTVDFSGLKLKLISSIVAISGIHLLKLFFNLNNYTKEQITLFIAVHLTFVFSGVILAYMDYIV